MGKIWAGVLVGILIILVGVCAYLLGQNQKLKNSAAYTQKPTKTENTLSSPTTSVAISLPPTATPAANVTVLIDAELNLPSQDVSEIRLRNVAPFIDWSTETRPQDKIALIKVTQNGNDPKYPYKFEYTYANGVNGGYLIQRTGGHIDWYYPECLNSCNFSASFKAKYPAIISKY